MGARLVVIIIVLFLQPDEKDLTAADAWCHAHAFRRLEGYRTSGDVLTSIPFDEPEKGVIESLTLGAIDTAGHYFNLAPLLS